MKNKRTGFILSIVLLVAGMTAGFILLSFVYDGPKWISFAVFIVYLFVVYFTVKASIGYLKAVDDAKNQKK